MEARPELTEAVRQRYRTAGRTEKKRILDEFAETPASPEIHYSGLRGRILAKTTFTTERQIYNEAVITALTILWEAADQSVAND